MGKACAPFPEPKSAGTSALQAEHWAPYGPVSLALLGVHCHWIQGSPVDCGCQMPTERLLALLSLGGQGEPQWLPHSSRNLLMRD